MWVAVVLCVQVAATYAQRYGLRRAWIMSTAPMICVAISAALVVRRKYWLAVLPLLVTQHIYYGGAWLFPQMLVHGRLSLQPCLPGRPQPFSLVVATAGERARMSSVSAELERHGLEYTLRQVDVTGDVGHRHCMVMRTLLLAETTTPWLLVLEDDAVLHWGFLGQLSCAQARERDVTFLDARTSIMRNLLGIYEGSSAGMLFKTSALPRITPHMCAGAPLYDEVGCLLAGCTNVTVDCLWGALCDRGMVSCQTWPLVSESGVATTHFTP